MAGELLDRQPGTLAKARVVETATARTDDRVALRQQPLVGQVVQCRNQLAVRQIAGRAKHDQRLRWRRRERHDAP
jgi:hypothetical protein